MEPALLLLTGRAVSQIGDRLNKNSIFRLQPEHLPSPRRDEHESAGGQREELSERFVCANLKFVPIHTFLLYLFRSAGVE